jgi:dTDP-4-amino-4,6-dideoxygalactose transaminase
MGIRVSGPTVGREEIDAVARVIRSGRLTNGEEIEAFERELARDLTHTAFVLAVSSGTAALELSLESIGVGPGDEVITPAFTFGATAAAVIRRGATVRFADVGDDLTIDVGSVSSLITDRTAAIIPVHLFGLPADVDALTAFGSPVVEDGAQAAGATLRGRPVGSLGSAGCFSFYPTKNMTTGEGGAIATDDPILASRVRLLRNHGMESRYDYKIPGTNLRMDEIAAAIGRIQLRRLPAFLEIRRSIAARYSAAFDGIDWLRVPRIDSDRTHAWNYFCVRVDPKVGRDALSESLEKQGVSTAVHYPAALCDVPAFRDHPLVAAKADCPNARRTAQEVLALPMHAHLTDEDAEKVIAAVAGYSP